MTFGEAPETERPGLGTESAGLAATEAPEVTGQPAAHTGIFRGPLGLRAGWGIALFLVIALLLGSMLVVVAVRFTGQSQELQRQSNAVKVARAHHQPPPVAETGVRLGFFGEAAQASAVLLAALALSFIERRRFGVYGLGLRRLRDALPGALWGIVSIAVLVGLLRGLHLLVFDRQTLHGGAVLRYGAAWLAMFALVGLFEEFVFRGYIQFTLTRGLLGLGERISPTHVRRTAFWGAALLWSAVFSLTHLLNAAEDPFGIGMVFFAGILFSYALWRTGSLWWGIGFHMTWDWGQSFLFGVPDSGTLSAGRMFATHAVGREWLSGGRTGPEGSLLVFPVLLLVFLVIRLHPLEPQPPVEPEVLPGLPATAAATTIP